MQDNQGSSLLVNISCYRREVDALKNQLRRIHEEKELNSRPQSNPAHEQDLQIARSRAQQAAAASAQQSKELAALKGWERQLVNSAFC